MNQKKTETTLIRNFLYPKYGPGQLWEVVAKKIVEKGGEIFMHHKVVGVENDKNIFESVLVKDDKLGIEKTVKGDYLFSTIPIHTLSKSSNK